MNLLLMIILLHLLQIIQVEMDYTLLNHHHQKKEHPKQNKKFIKVLMKTSVLLILLKKKIQEEESLHQRKYILKSIINIMAIIT
uniref:Putative secreted protein n=1 Tax=Xenopsylla cheopis TaxID=163159 RepID=A0A6M2DW37_XENCH